MSHVHARVHVHAGEMLRWALQAPDVRAAGPQRAPRGRPAEYVIHWVAKDYDGNVLQGKTVWEIARSTCLATRSWLRWQYVH